MKNLILILSLLISNYCISQVNGIAYTNKQNYLKRVFFSDSALMAQNGDTLSIISNEKIYYCTVIKSYGVDFITKPDMLISDDLLLKNRCAEISVFDSLSITNNEWRNYFIKLYDELPLYYVFKTSSLIKDVRPNNCYSFYYAETYYNLKDNVLLNYGINDTITNEEFYCFCLRIKQNNDWNEITFIFISLTNCLVIEVFGKIDEDTLLLSRSIESL